MRGGEAREQVEALGLELVEDEAEYSETVPQGVVISQSADAEALPEGGEVHVVVSQGRQPLSVPDQTGAPAASARSTIQAATAVGVLKLVCATSSATS